jgi:aminoglycoside 6'-N-acetyltransferase
MAPSSAHAPVPDLITGTRVTLIAVQLEHAQRLRQILAEPAASRWWGEIDPEFPFDADDDTAAFAVVHAGEVIGFAQFYENPDPMYRYAGIDLVLTTAKHRQGLGRETVGVLAQHLIEVRGHHRLVIDPCTQNSAAIACYRSAGFEPVGVMRQYEQAPDGGWRDGLLMELIASDRRRPDSAG